MGDRSYCNSNGPSMSNGNSAYNGPLVKVVHGWFCACHWCLTGVHA